MSCTIFVMCVYTYLLIFPLRLSAAMSSVWEGFAFQFLLSEYLAENKISSQQKFRHGQIFLLGHSRWSDSTGDGGVSTDRCSALAWGPIAQADFSTLHLRIAGIHRGIAICQRLVSILWRRKWQPTPVFLPGKSHGQSSLVVYSPQGRKESQVT